MSWHSAKCCLATLNTRGSQPTTPAGTSKANKLNSCLYSNNLLRESHNLCPGLPHCIILLASLHKPGNHALLAVLPHGSHQDSRIPLQHLAARAHYGVMVGLLADLL